MQKPESSFLPAVFSSARSKPILTPCIGVCVIGADGLCEGCQRTGEEIAGWRDFSDAQRHQLMDVILPARADAVAHPMHAADMVHRLQHAVRTLDDPPQPPGWNHAELQGLINSASLAPAAVLVPIVTRAAGLTVLLTRRTDHLSQHAGQVSFPGGRVETSDADSVAAAVRETCEEVGIAPASIRPFGFLDCFETVSAFCVTPVLAWVQADYRARPDPREVAQVFEVPLAFFLEPANLRRNVMDFAGVAREIFEFAHSGQRIWGATAAMLINLVQRMDKIS